MEDQRVFLSDEEAIAMLPDGDTVHTFLGDRVLIGADWPKADVEREIREHGAELSGPVATAAHHGICIRGRRSPLFVETRQAGDGREGRG